MGLGVKRTAGESGGLPGPGALAGAGSGSTSFSTSPRRYYWSLLLVLAAFCSGLYVLLYYRATLSASSVLVFPRMPGFFFSKNTLPMPLSPRVASDQGSSNASSSSSSSSSIIFTPSLPKSGNASTSKPATGNASSSASSSFFPYKSTEELRKAIVNGSHPPLLTLFSTWVNRSDLVLVRNLTLRNWASLKPWVQPLLFTNDSVLAAEAQAAGWAVLPVSKVAVGVPILKNMYLDAMPRFNSTLFAFANGDLLFTQGLVDSLVAVLSDSSLDIEKRGMLAIGQRTNVFMVQEHEARTFSSLQSVAKARGKLFITMAEDFFITGRRFEWAEIPAVVIGRVAYDNWVVLHAIHKGYVVVDMTSTALVVHQTTKKGNSEGFTHSNTHYNDNILRRLYKSIHYRGGCVDCAPWRTLTSPEGAVYVEKKKSRPRYCW